jgi:riboflavin kinase/FMN adenylyltransferase
MRVEYSLGPLPPLGPAVLTIGFFDGVHLGHRRLISRAAELARQQGARAVAVTFWPHPAAVVRPEAPPTLLSTLDEKLALLEGLGLLNAAIVVPFTGEIAHLRPEAFLDRLASWCEPRALVEGVDFALGHNRAGTVAYLRELGMRRGFAVEALEVHEDGARVSSSRIRALLREGDVAGATRLLGRSYTLCGEVVLGDQRGRLLGFPTANLRLDARKLMPENGIYAMRARLPGETTARHPAVASIGVRPTFGDGLRRLVEVHLLDATMDLYGLELEVEVVARLREERRYDDVEALKWQMRLDADQARELLARGG